MIRALESRPWLRRTLQVILTVVPLAFLATSLVNNWQAMQAYEWQLTPWRGAASIVLLMAAFGLLPLAAQQAMIGLGHQLKYPVAYCGYFIAQLAKYLPGGIWIIPGRMLVFRQHGVNSAVSGIGIIVELAMLLIAGAVSFLPYLLAVGSQSISQAVLIALLAVPILLLMMYPRFFNAASGYLLALAGYSNVPVELSGRRIATILLIDLLFWQAIGIAFFVLATSLQPLPTEYWLPFSAAFSMAWVIGFLAFLTPSGIGVREGALALLLTPFLAPPLPVVIALTARVWWTIGDLLSAAIAGLIRKRLHTTTHQVANDSLAPINEVLK